MSKKVFQLNFIDSFMKVSNCDVVCFCEKIINPSVDRLIA